MKVLDDNKKKTRGILLLAIGVYVSALVLTMAFSMHQSETSSVEGGADLKGDYEEVLNRHSVLKAQYELRMDSINTVLGNKNIERLNEKITELKEELEEENVDYDLELQEINSSISTLETKLSGCMSSSEEDKEELRKEEKERKIKTI